MNPVLTSALWYLGRGTGLVALLLLTAAVVLGILSRSGRGWRRAPRFALSGAHRWVALTATGLVALHVTTLLLDPFAQLRLLDLVVPFGSAYRPLWVGLGVLALELLVVITATSLLRPVIGARAFRVVHWATYALWPTAFLHALGAGTDSGTGWLRLAAVGCAGAVALALGWRAGPAFAERGRRRMPRKVVAR